MIDVAELRRLRRVARVDFWIAVAAIVGVLSAGVLAGVVIGVALSLVWLIHVATTPRSRGSAGSRARRSSATPTSPGDETFDGMIILRLDFGLSFATAEALEERVRALLDAEPSRAPSCSTSPAWTSSTPRARRSWARSAGSPDAVRRDAAHRARSSRRSARCSSPTACSTDRRRRHLREAAGRRQPNSVSAGSRSPRSSARSTSTHAMPRASASTRAWGLTICAASMPRQSALPGSSRIRSR